MGFLDNVSTGDDHASERVLLYGTTGVGKTSAACSFPDPLVIPIEDGLDALKHVKRVKPRPRTFEDVLAVGDEFLKRWPKLPYKTLVYDTADALERLIWNYVCRANNFQGKKWKSIESPGWGKGYNEALRVWMEKFFPQLDKLHDAGVHVVVTAQCQVKNWTNPSGENFDRYQLKLHEKVGGLLQEWVADQFFCQHWTGVTVDKDARGQVKVLGQSSGERIAHTVWDAAHNAKHRLSVPDQISMPDPRVGSFYESLLAARAEGASRAPRRKEASQAEAESEPDGEKEEEEPASESED